MTNSNTDASILQGRDGSVLSPYPYPTQSTSVNGAHTFPAVFPKAKKCLGLGVGSINVDIFMIAQIRGSVGVHNWGCQTGRF